MLTNKELELLSKIFIEEHISDIGYQDFHYCPNNNYNNNNLKISYSGKEALEKLIKNKPLCDVPLYINPGPDCSYLDSVIAKWRLQIGK